ncbi:MAG: tRNA pseudouridine synthase A [Myxococcaceae bacterium]
MRRSVVAVWVWYRGEPFRGFQIQVEGDTVQGVLKRALASLGIVASPSPAGRTDLGVHARMQVVSFRAPEELFPAELHQRLSPLLPKGLGVCLVKRPPARFHAQWRCSGKEYRYRLSLGAIPRGWEGSAWRPSESPRLAGRRPSPERLDELLRSAEGTRDFGAFHESSSVRGPRTLHRSRLVELGDGLFEARLRGDRFGRYQVRYLVGSAVAAAAGCLEAEDFQAALERGAALGGLKAPAQGLVLWEVHYPPEADPFTAAERAAPPLLPGGPPFAGERD